jgi:hypothetical protein
MNDIKLSVNHISKILRKEGYTYKKVQKEITNLSNDIFIGKIKKEESKKKMINEKNRNIISIDETSICLNETLNYGRSKKMRNV